MGKASGQSAIWPLLSLKRERSHFFVHLSIHLIKTLFMRSLMKLVPFWLEQSHSFVDGWWGWPVRDKGVSEEAMRINSSLYSMVGRLLVEMKLGLQETLWALPRHAGKWQRLGAAFPLNRVNRTEQRAAIPTLFPMFTTRAIGKAFL